MPATMMEQENNQELAIRTSEDTQRSLVLSSRVLVQRACNHSAVETYRYDVDGKLTGAEADITTWEERNTEIYGWLNAQAPPFEPRQPVNRFRRVDGSIRSSTLPSAANDPTSVADYEALLDKMATQVRTVQPLKSKTVKAEKQQQPPQKTSSKDDLTLNSNMTTIDGSRRAHSEHCVTYKSSSSDQPASPMHANNNITARQLQQPTPAAAKLHGVAAPVQKGRQVWTPPGSSSTAQIGGGSRKPGFVKPSPVGCRPTEDFGTAFNGVTNNNSTMMQQQSSVPSLTSLAERQRQRCVESKMRKASSSGKHQQQQQQHPAHLHHRQWKHVDSAKNY